ncbi:hypothetical protein E2C01_052768 [Portunus trituberculatus]|uniref:Uncharacterized protein n=1 Tax=Portunus trituberculatus TaxID=210409 RepID=A0A5B7GMD0_PORTR|nr:hypothetical protein [Portunus trituberculatus]
MLQRQAEVDSLPHTFSDREKRWLLSSPFSAMLFDPAVLARVQKNEHLASQQRALFSVVWCWPLLFGAQPLHPWGAK